MDEIINLEDDSINMHLFLIWKRKQWKNKIKCNFCNKDINTNFLCLKCNKYYHESCFLK